MVGVVTVVDVVGVVTLVVQLGVVVAAVKHGEGPEGAWALPIILTGTFSGQVLHAALRFNVFFSIKREN